MKIKSLEAFVVKLIERNRITFADCRRLQRDLLPNGILTRAEAELLLALDRSIGRQDESWCDWLTAVVVDFVVWGERPTGYVTPEIAAWLDMALDAQGTPTSTARRILKAISEEAQGFTEEAAPVALAA